MTSRSVSANARTTEEPQAWGSATPNLGAMPGYFLTPLQTLNIKLYKHINAMTTMRLFEFKNLFIDVVLTRNILPSVKKDAFGTKQSWPPREHKLPRRRPGVRCLQVEQLEPMQQPLWPRTKGS